MRWFVLTSDALSYAAAKGSPPSSVFPLSGMADVRDIGDGRLEVSTGEESSDDGPGPPRSYPIEVPSA